MRQDHRRSQLDAGCALDDDRLDAFVAYRLGLDFIEGRASGPVM